MEGEIYYPGYTLDREISNYIKVWISVIVSLCYCYFSAKFFPKGMTRLFSIIPIFALFFTLPLKLHSANLCSTTGFIIAWISNFKLLLLAFGKGPLSDPSLSLPHFIAIACFPVRIPQQPLPNKHANLETSLKSQNRVHPYPLDEDGHSKKNPPPSQNPYPKITQKGHTSIWNYAIKGVLAALFFHFYKYIDRKYPRFMLVLYWFQIYFLLEIILAIATASAQVFGLEFEPAFNNPFLSTSVQDFWGRRWNLVVSQTLRSTVYEPARLVSERLIGREWATLPAVMCTFLVSALMHEILLYYMGRMQPTWEVTGLFLFHGACVVVDIWIKKVFKGTWRLPRLIATPMTLGFVMGTGSWLFVPQLLRCKMPVRASEEYALVGNFLKELVVRVAKFF